MEMLNLHRQKELKDAQEWQAKSPYKHKNVYIERTMVWETVHDYTLRCPACDAFVHFTTVFHQVVPVPLGGKAWEPPHGALPPHEIPEGEWMPASMCPDCGIACEPVSPSSIDTFHRIVPTGDDCQELLDRVEETRPDLAGQERRWGGSCSVTV